MQTDWFEANFFFVLKKILYQAADVNALASLDREDVKKICGENLPEWVSFPEYEQVQ